MFRSISSWKWNLENYLEKKKIDLDCLKEDKKEFVKNKLMLKKLHKDWKA